MFDPLPASQVVRVYDDLGAVPQPFTKVGLVVGEGSASVSFAAIVEGMCSAARSIGADALVLTRRVHRIDRGDECVSFAPQVEAWAVRTGR